MLYSHIFTTVICVHTRAQVDLGAIRICLINPLVVCGHANQPLRQTIYEVDIDVQIALISTLAKQGSSNNDSITQYR